MTVPHGETIRRETYQGHDIEVWPVVSPDVLGRKSVCLVIVFRNGAEVFRATVEVTTQVEPDSETRQALACDYATRLAHGAIDLDRYTTGDQLSLSVTSSFDPAERDLDPDDEVLRVELLRALRRMHREQSLTSTVLELDVEGVGLVLRISPNRIRATLGELIAEGLVEGFAESFGATAVDGRCRITGAGIQQLRRIDAESADSERHADTSEVEDWNLSHGQQWADLEVRMSGLRNELQAAADLDGFQDVGRRCREILKDAANVVFDESLVPNGEEVPGLDDAKARIEYYLRARVAGSSYRDLRSLVKQAYVLAQTVTHSRSSDRIMAFAAAQATVLIVRTLQQIDKAGEQ